MRLLSWNVNGLRAQLKKGFIEWLQQESPDILAIQETKSKVEQLPKKLLNLEGYHQYYSEATVKKGYSGVGIFTKKDPTSINRDLGIEKFDGEGRVLKADYGDFLFYNVYFPNGKASDERLRYKMEFYDAFLDHVEAQRKEGKEIIICGDVNTAHKALDLARPKPNETVSGFLPEEREWIDKFLDHGYVDTFRMFHEEGENYTFWDQKTRARDRNVGWRIDYFYVSDGLKDKVKDAFIMSDVMGSDHCPVGIELEIDS